MSTLESPVSPLESPVNPNDLTDLPAATPSKSGAVLKFVFKCAFGLLLVLWLIKSGRLDLHFLSRTRVGWPFWGVIGAQCAMILCQTFRWHLLTRAQQVPLTLVDSLRISAMAQFAGVFTPANAGTDWLRWHQASRLAPRRKHGIFAALLLDRVLGMLVLIAMSALLFPLAPFASQYRFIIFGLCGILALCVLAFFLWKRRLARRKAQPAQDAQNASNKITALFRKLMQALDDYHAPEQHRALLGATGWSLLTHICNSFAYLLGFWMLGIHASTLTIFAIAPLIILSFAIPLTPLGLGFADLTASTLFTAAGLAGGAEVTMILRVTWILISLFCGLTFLKSPGPTSQV